MSQKGCPYYNTVAEATIITKRFWERWGINMGIYNDKELEFTVYLINKVADYLQKPITQVYAILDNVDIIDGYIIKCYDVLHTLGENYLVRDIVELMQIRGVEI